MTIKAQYRELVSARELHDGQSVKIWGRWRKVAHVEIRVLLDDGQEIHVFTPDYALELKPER